MLESFEQFESKLEQDLLELEQALELREAAVAQRIRTLATMWNTHSLPIAE